MLMTIIHIFYLFFWWMYGFVQFFSQQSQQQREWEEVISTFLLPNYSPLLFLRLLRYSLLVCFYVPFSYFFCFFFLLLVCFSILIIIFDSFQRLVSHTKCTHMHTYTNVYLNFLILSSHILLVFSFSGKYKDPNDFFYQLIKIDNKTKSLLFSFIMSIFRLKILSFLIFTLKEDMTELGSLSLFLFF